MGGISDEHVEWAVVNRLKAMLDEPPETKFNVTQSFALFSSVVLWTKNRAWVGGNQQHRPHWFGELDHAAQDAREKLRKTLICETPWLLSRTPPKVVMVDLRHEAHPDAQDINSDFANMNAEVFFKWLRDALAHGDGRTIRPIHKWSARENRTLLAGFEIIFAERRGSNRQLTLALYHADMKRIGSVLADSFCEALSGGDEYFEKEAGTASIQEAV